MNVHELHAGAYRLFVNADNPNPDRRTRDDWARAARFPAGRYFVRIRDEDYPAADKLPAFVVHHVTISRRWKGRTNSLRFACHMRDGQWTVVRADEPEPKAALALLAKLEVDPSLDGYVHYHEREEYLDCRKVLVALEKKGIVARALIEQTIAAVLADEDEDEDGA